MSIDYDLVGQPSYILLLGYPVNSYICQLVRRLTHTVFVQLILWSGRTVVNSYLVNFTRLLVLSYFRETMEFEVHIDLLQK